MIVLVSGFSFLVDWQLHSCSWIVDAHSFLESFNALTLRIPDSEEKLNLIHQFQTNSCHLFIKNEVHDNFKRYITKHDQHIFPVNNLLVGGTG